MPDARGRLVSGRPIAVVDIGSNSVRLVAYEGLNRAPTPIFNEKALCGLGRGVGKTGRLPADGVKQALAALARFRTLVRLMGISDVRVLATAAARDAANGPAFLAEAEQAIGARIELISGPREAELSAKGVISGVFQPDGIVGDLGGGSLELIDVVGSAMGRGVSFRLGGIALQDSSSNSPKKAVKIVRDALSTLDLGGAGRAFYAVGGTWRSFARLHMRQIDYPLDVMHGYTIAADEAIAFCRLLQRVDPATLLAIETVSSARRPLLAYGAIVLEAVLRQTGCARVVFSAMGVREGLLFELLDDRVRAADPLISAAQELNLLRSRSPRHGEELGDWMDALFLALGLDDTVEERRLRRAACLLADIGWRAHPDYRGEQSLNIIAHAAFTGVDHPGRAFIALAVYYRHVGFSEDGISPRVKALASPRLVERARLIGAAMRVAYILSAAMPGVLNRVGLTVSDTTIALRLPADVAELASDRLLNRLRGLAKLVAREPLIEIAAA